MKKYMAGGITALITLAVIGMTTGQSQASSHLRSGEDIICHQQNPEVKICPVCKGTGEVGKCIQCSRCGGKGIVKG
ncbi:hypothetical protein [Akkermansia massiliensis]